MSSVGVIGCEQESSDTYSLTDRHRRVAVILQRAMDLVANDLGRQAE